MAQYPRSRHAQPTAVLMAVVFTIMPSLGQGDDVPTPFDRFLSDELELLKEEESVSIESQKEHRSPSVASEPYVMTEQDIRESGAADLPSLLRRILRLDDPQATESEIHRRGRADRQPITNNFLVVVDRHPIHIDTSDTLAWKNIPVTLPDVQRLEMWKNSSSAVHGFHGYESVIKITTKTSER